MISPKAPWTLVATTLLSLAASSAGCGDDGGSGGGAAGGADASGGGGGDAMTAEPAEVKAAVDACYATLHGDVAGRADAIAQLVAATEQYPDSGRAHLFLGMCSLAALTEDGDLSALKHVEPALDRAYELMPEDHRIPGWIGTLKVAMARMSGDQAAIDAAVTETIAAADLDPEFNNVSLAIAFMPFPLETGLPDMAVERLEAIIDCGATDERCRDNAAAPHNVPGSMMLFGDAYARVGNRDAALAYYEQALAAESAPTWAFGTDAQQFVDGIDARIANFTDANTANDPAFFLSGVRTCRSCHE